MANESEIRMQAEKNLAEAFEHINTVRQTVSGVSLVPEALQVRIADAQILEISKTAELERELRKSYQLAKIRTTRINQLGCFVIVCFVLLIVIRQGGDIAWPLTTLAIASLCVFGGAASALANGFGKIASKIAS